MRISFESPKGGQGLTSTMCGIAAAYAENGDLVSIQESPDVFAILGWPEQSEPYNWIEIVPSLEVFRWEANPDSDIVVGENLENPDKRILVIHPCYLALRRAMRNDLSVYDGVITFTQEGRALTSRDLRDILDKPIIANIPWIPEIARSIDAGVFARRIAKSYIKASMEVFS